MSIPEIVESEKIMSEASRKVVIKRIILFLLICFGITWIYEFTVYPHIVSIKSGAGRNILSTLVMYFPMIALIITKVICKEKFLLSGPGSLMLTIDRKKVIWLLIGVLIPVLYCEVGNALLLLFYPNLLLTKGMLSALGITSNVYYRQVGFNLLSGIFFALVAIGEESGFRGYMMPGLISVFGKGKAVILGGIIWGLWHLPLVCMGHNYGTSYPGFPYLGIVLMIVECICAGSILTYLTLKSGSIWPASLMHAVNNCQPRLVLTFINTHALDRMNAIKVALISRTPLYILGIICLFVLIKRQIDTEDAEVSDK